MKSYTYYNKDTGEIVGTLTGAQFEYLPQCSRIDGLYPGDQYFMRGTTPVARKPFNITVAGKTITGIPVGTTVNVDGNNLVVNDGVLEVVPLPNIKPRVQLTHPEYILKELTL